MRRVLPYLLAVLPAVAAAEDRRDASPRPRAATTAPVIGGGDAPAGKWPDAAATIHPDGSQECSGTLIAPTVVLTAAHCIYGGGLPSPAGVVVGTTSLARRTDGDVLSVAQRVAYPNSDRTYDIGVLVLAQPSRFEPRPIASGWARADIQNGASIALVGYGAIDRNSTMYINELQEAMTTVTDADCTKSAGCNSLAKPGGELGAGGMGIDTCPGDSGGPLYLVTSYGTFLAGVTSRGYDTNNYDCSEGGIYARPDKIVDWIEETAGVPVARGPEPAPSEPLTAVRGHAAETTVVHNDPRGGDHTFAIATQPGYGSAAIRGDGRLRVCTDPGVVGDDAVAVTVTDAGDASRSVTVTIPLTIEDGDPGADCDPEAFGDDVGGCCDAGRSATGSLPLALGLLVVLRRRRR